MEQYHNYLNRVDANNFTYGAELELPNIDNSVDIEDLGTYCTTEYEIINFNGLGNDCTRTFNFRGAEIQTKVSKSVDEFTELLSTDIAARFNINNNDKINDTPFMPNAFHFHIRVPELLKDENADILRQVMIILDRNFREIKYQFTQIPDKDTILSYTDHLSQEYQKAILKRFDLARRDRQYSFNETIVNRLKNVKPINKNIVLECLASKKKSGQVNWASARRTSVNFKKLRDGDLGTIEFRMIPPNLNKNMVIKYINYVKDMVLASIQGQSYGIENTLGMQNIYDASLLSNVTNEIMGNWFKTNYGGLSGLSLKERRENVKNMLLLGQLSSHDIQE